MRRHREMFDIPNMLSQLNSYTYIIAGCTLTKKWNKEILIFVIYDKEELISRIQIAKH